MIYFLLFAIGFTHALTLIAGLLLLLACATGRLQGGKFDPKTGEQIPDRITMIMPVIAGAVLAISGAGGLFV